MRGAHAFGLALAGAGALALVLAVSEGRGGWRRAPRLARPAPAAGPVARSAALARPPRADGRAPGEEGRALAPAPRGGGGRTALADLVVTLELPAGARAPGARLLLERGSAAWDCRPLDERGEARFGALPPARYRVSLVPGSLPGGLVVVPDAATGEAARRARLAAGDRARLTLRVARAAALQGVARDGQGVPLEGALVRVQAARALDGVLEASARTDALGRFALEDLPPGEHRVHADWPDGEPSAAPPPRLVTLAAGEVHALALEGEARGRSLAGRLVDADGAPLAGVALVCELDDGPAPPCPTRDERPRRGADLARATSDAEGIFRFERLPAARLRVRAGEARGAGPRRARPGCMPTLLGSFDLGAIASVDLGTAVVARPREDG